MTQFVDPSILPVEEQVAWEKAPFDDMAKKLSMANGYAPWKEAEVLGCIQLIFQSEIASGKSFDEAVGAIENAVSRA